MKKITQLLSVCAFVFASNANAEVCTASNNGAWSSAATWDCGHAPSDNDTIWVPIGITVNVDINSPEYDSMLVIVDGALYFEVGQKINICPGGVYVSSTGMLDGGNPGSKIDICGTTLWTGPGPTYGPSSYGDVTLPATLVDFDGNVHILEVDIDWATGTETNAEFFSVGRSTNGMTFVEIAIIPSKGPSKSTQNYTFKDTAAPEGTVYYRLEVIDANGRREKIGETVVEVEKTKTDGQCQMVVFPNPCEGQCTVNLSECPDDQNGNISLQVIDANGQLVSEQVPERNTNGGFTTTIDATNNMKPGVYIIRGVSSKSTYTQNAVIK